MRASSWRTRDISLGGKNFTDINFANTGNQVAFIDAIKYFQQVLAILVNTMTDEERERIKNEC